MSTTKQEKRHFPAIICHRETSEVSSADSSNRCSIPLVLRWAVRRPVWPSILQESHIYASVCAFLSSHCSRPRSRGVTRVFCGLAHALAWGSGNCTHSKSHKAQQMTRKVDYFYINLAVCDFTGNLWASIACKEPADPLVRRERDRPAPFTAGGSLLHHSPKKTPLHFL